MGPAAQACGQVLGHSPSERPALETGVKKNSGLDLRYVGPEVPEFIIFWIHNKWMEKSVINIDRKCNKTNVEEELIQIPYQAAENFQRSCFR